MCRLIDLGQQQNENAHRSHVIVQLLLIDRV